MRHRLVAMLPLLAPLVAQAPSPEPPAARWLAFARAMEA
jgi:hypothetical protein